MEKKIFEDGKVILVASGSRKDSEEYIRQYFKELTEVHKQKSYRKQTKK